MNYRISIIDFINLNIFLKFLEKVKSDGSIVPVRNTNRDESRGSIVPVRNTNPYPEVFLENFSSFAFY